MPSADSRELLALFRAGDSAAAGRIFDRYVERLIALAAARLAPSLRRRVDPEDVVQSAYRSFFTHAREGQYLVDRSGDLWRLLAAITLHKLHGQIERHTAGRRDFRRERESTPPADGESVELPEAAALQPSPAEAIALAEQFALVIHRLGDEQRVVFERSLAGDSIDHIAKRLGRSARTIRRLLDQVRTELGRELLQPSDTQRSPIRTGRPPANLAYSDFVLEALVGAGGMGKVYRARLKTRPRRLAIKTLHKRRQTDPIAVARFLAEAEMLMRLRHPGIVGIHGIGQFPGGGFFLALDLVDGRDLQKFLADGPLEIAEAVRVTRAAADAVAFAHDHGIVHADLKPANILMDEAGGVFVTDFGFAQLLPTAGSSEAFAVGRGGTLAYLPPELWRDPAAPATISGDIYGLGGILYAALTARAPNSTAAGQSHRWRPPLAPSRHRADVPPVLEAICLNCLAERPKDRYASARKLAEALSIPPTA
jgi:RNA polymerase sigma factor (sigma-70 family)